MFTTRTKSPGSENGCGKKQKVNDSIQGSLQTTGLSCVETIFLHSPDPSTLFKETLDAYEVCFSEEHSKKAAFLNPTLKDCTKLMKYALVAGTHTGKPTSLAIKCPRYLMLLPHP